MRGVVSALLASALVVACGGTAASPSPSPTAAAKATVAPATAAPATAAPTPVATPAPVPAAVVNVEASEAANGFFLKADQIAVPAGKVTFNFKNVGKMTHDFFVYPIQDLSAMLVLKRQDKSGVDEAKYIKELAGGADDIEGGKSATVEATLKPGFYELACHAHGKNPDGSTYSHFDKGQTLTLAVYGAGGPAASVATAASTMSIEMKGEETGSWLFVPDRLVVTAGDVTFKVTNSMKMAHDFAVYPLGDVSGFVAKKFSGTEDYTLIKATELMGDLGPGKTDSKTVKLTPGVWSVACFIVSKNADGTSFMHRDRGQRIVFIVK